MLPDLFLQAQGAFGSTLRGFLQGLPQGITAARNELARQAAGGPGTPTAPPARGLAGAFNPMGGLPAQMLGGADIQRITDAFLQGFQAEQPPAPTAIRTMFGQGTPQKVADYLLDFAQPETGFALGPAYEATVGRAIGAGLKGVKWALSPALETALGQLVAQRGLAPLGLGPSAQMLREVTKPYEQRVAVRLQEGGQIAREMRKSMQGLRLADPAFDLRMGQLAKGDPGPLQRLAQKYAVLNLQQGPQALPTSIDNQAIQLTAAAEGVPYAVVKQYGEALLAHMRETIADLYQTGATPFVKARGTQFQVPKTPPAGAWYKNPYFAATAVSAKPIAEDRLRRRFAKAYLAQLFAAETPKALGQVGAAAFTGSGIRAVRRAGVRALINRLIDPADPLSQYASAGYRPGFVQVPGVRDFERLKGVWLPQPLYRYLASEMGLAGAKVYTRFGRRTGPLLTDAQRGWATLGTWAEKVAGVQKKLWIGNFATAGSNVISNQTAVELAAAREGFSQAQFAAALPAAAKEVLQYRLTGRASADIQGLRQFSRSFVETQAATAALSGKKGLKELAGLTGRAVTLPGGKRVLLPAAGELASRAGNALVTLHDYPEKAYKLALYKVLAPSHGPEEAAKLVEKYLFDYSDRGALLETLDRHGLWVFNAFPTKATALLLDTLIHRPDLVARYPRLQAQLMGEVRGAREHYRALPEYAKGAFTLPTEDPRRFLDVSRQHLFGDPLRTAQEVADAIRERRLPGFLSLDELANLPGHTALSPALAAFQNRQFYGSTAHPVRLSHPGAPAERQAIERASAALTQMAPGFVGALGKYAAARAGVPPTGGAYAEPRDPADVLLQGFLGVRPIEASTQREKVTRLRASPERARELAETRRYASHARDYLLGHPELNRYVESLSRRENYREIQTELFDAEKYLKSLLTGPLDRGRQRALNDAVARLIALRDRARQLKP